MHRIRRPLRRNASTIAAVAAVLLVQLLVVVVLATAAGAQTGTPGPVVAYTPPVDAPLVDVFRPPATPYGPGNRGIDYATIGGEAVRAAAAGDVVFAGAIGATSHVVVLHADGIRTSYSFLAGTSVGRGDHVEEGDVVGTANAGDLHFGARLGDDTYVDPLVLLGREAGARPRVHLVPDDDTRPLAEVEERAHLVDSLRGLVDRAVGMTGDAAGWLADHAHDAAERKIVLARVVASDLQSLAVPLTLHLAIAAATWRQQQTSCTPPDEPAPTTAPERRIVVLVGGLGSATASAAVLDVDTAALGYAPADVHQFSYRRDRGAYGQADTLGDIGAAGERLAADLGALAAQHPGIPIDVIAHSQGGLVARAAITPTPGRPHPPHVATLVTLATPHRGTDLATAAAGVEGSRAGRLLLAGAGRVPGVAVDPGGASVQQMAEVSGFVGGLPDRGWPPDTHVVSVAARGDPVVPSFHSTLAGAANVVVSVGGTTSAADHSRLPGSAEAQREIALAVAGRPPTCRSLTDHLDDVAAARTTSQAEDAAGLALTAAGVLVDVRTGGVVGLPNR